MDDKVKVPRKLKKQIPEGPYCYKGLSVDEETGIYHVKHCVFYTHIKCKDKPVQDEVDKEFPEEVDGWCKLLKCTIDDQVKNCSINWKH